MCVILAVPNEAQDVTQEEFYSANSYNSDGFGAAWIDKTTGKVKFFKVVGKEIEKYIDWRPPKPYVFHFRIATVGGKTPSLCHPFVVSKKSELKTKGLANKVLFHNGHWGDWNTWLGITFSGVGRLPTGEYSDSRTMALILAHYGQDALDISGATTGQKIAILDKNKGLITLGDFDLDKEDGILRSNQYHNYMHGHYYSSNHQYNSDDTVICSSCKKLTSFPDIQGRCLNCTSTKNTSVTTRTERKIKAVCQLCFDAVPFNEVMCKECDGAVGELYCFNDKCYNRLFVDQSLASKECFSCRKDKPLTDISNVFAAWFDVVKSIVKRVHGDNALIVPFTFEAAVNKHGQRTASIIMLDHRKSKFVTADYVFYDNEPNLGTTRYRVEYKAVKMEQDENGKGKV